MSNKAFADCEKGSLSVTGWDDQGLCPYCHPLIGNKDYLGMVIQHSQKPASSGNSDVVSKKDELWDYYQNFVQAHGADSITNLVVQRDDLREFLEKWVLDGRLQTFDDRQRFRKEAKSLLALEVTSE